MLPLRDPLHPLTELIRNPLLGVTVNEVVLPWLTLADPGLMEPPDPAVAVTV